MIFHSPYPDIDIPETPLTPFVLRHAGRMADATALIDGETGRALTYGQLARDVERAAAGLAEAGYRKGDVIAIQAPSSLDYAIAFHAIASIGGIAAPINSSSTVEETALRLSDTDARCLITTPELLDHAAEAASTAGTRELITFGDTPNAIPFARLLASEAPAPDVTINPRDDVVAILCSSGTTGLPKGVQITHSNVVAIISQVAAVIPVGEEDTIPGQLPFFHIFGLVVSLNLGLAQGARSVIIPRFDLATFLEILQNYRATRLFLVPPTVLQLAQHPIVDAYDLSSLRSIYAAAAPLGAELARACADRVGCSVRQMYGMTEIAPSHIAPDDDTRDTSGTVGPCAPSVECRIVDLTTGTELGPEERGEILVRGPNITKGYLNQPDATAALIDADGWVHTGDVGWCDADGNLTVADRLKEMIKYKAHQVAPAELEAVLLTHPTVADAAVIRSPDLEAGEVPKAFVVLRSDATAEEIMAFVAARVAPYKKVRRLEFIDAIPKSPSGKILRRVLLERDLLATQSPA